MTEEAGFGSDVEVYRIYPGSKGTAADTLGATVRLFLHSKFQNEPFFLITGKSDISKFSFEDESISEESFSSSHSDLKTDCNSGSVFGSPLKLQPIANLSESKLTATSTPVVEVSAKKHEDVFPAVASSRRSKEILNLFIKKDFDADQMNMALVLSYDQDNIKKTILQGVYKGRNSKKEKEITTFDIKMWRLDSPELNLSVSGDCHMSSCHNIMEHEGMGWITIWAKWSEAVGKMKLGTFDRLPLPVHRTSFDASLCIQSGSEHSPVYNNYCDLQRIMVYLAAMTGIAGLPTSTTKTDTADLMTTFFKNLKEGISPPVDPLLGQVRGSAASITKKLNLADRVNKDFTDYLWQILSQCSDMTMVTKCLSQVFLFLKRGDGNVYVNNDNDTAIAKLVRSSHSNSAVFPALIGSLPARLAGEIGVNKVLKDLRNIFLSNRLCTEGQWNNFFKSQVDESDLSMDMEDVNQKDLTSKAKTLSKLHNCLEVVSVVDSFMDGQNLVDITKMVMNAHQSEERTGSEVFSFSMTAVQALPAINKCPPSSISRESTSAGKTTIDCLLELPPCMNFFPENNVNPESVSNSIGEAKDCFHVHTKSSSVYFGE